MSTSIYVANLSTTDVDLSGIYVANPSTADVDLSGIYMASPSTTDVAWYSWYLCGYALDHWCRLVFMWLTPRLDPPFGSATEDPPMSSGHPRI